MVQSQMNNMYPITLNKTQFVLLANLLNSRQLSVANASARTLVEIQDIIQPTVDILIAEDEAADKEEAERLAAEAAKLD